MHWTPVDRAFYAGMIVGVVGHAIVSTVIRVVM